MNSKTSIILKRFAGNEKSYEILYGFAPTALGEVFIGCISDESNTICHLHFVQKDPMHYIQQLQSRWPVSTLSANNCLAQLKAEYLFNTAGGTTDVNEVLAVNGTAFQLDVWNALLTIPIGETRTYTEVAEMLKKPKAVRAVANAVASNEIAFLIPCHRVVSKGGNLLKYRWGGQLKKQLMEFEKEML